MKDSAYLSWVLPTPICRDPLPDIDMPICLRAVLFRRGLTRDSQAAEFLYPSALPDPKNHYPELGFAIETLINAYQNNEKVAICGDYDADGMTSTALLLKAFKQMNIQAIPAIPSRIEEGYGLNKSIVRNLFNKGVKTIITVDNGINAFDAIELANTLGINVILTDHHQIKDKPPIVKALIHKSTIPEDSPYVGLAGVGLAYLLASTLAKELNSVNALKDSLDLFCIGTIADMAPLVESNRKLLIDGLDNIHNTDCQGLKCLFKVAGIKKRHINSDDIGFQIAPRINAVGRIGNPYLILELLTEDSAEKAMQLARNCDKLNQERKEITTTIFTEIQSIIESEQHKIPSFLLIAQSHWHQGVVGLVASRIVERYNRPTALLAGITNGHFRGSVRAPDGFSVTKALDKCSDHLETYGGHTAAGGFTVKPSNISIISEILNKYADEWLLSEVGVKSIKPDAYLKLSEINLDLWHEYKKLEPFGVENSRPIFWSRKVNVVKKIFIKGGHRKYILSQDNSILEAIQWNVYNSTQIPDIVDIAFHININNWRNQNTLQLELKDIRPYKKVITLFKGKRSYKCCINSFNEGNIVNEKNEELAFSMNKNSQEKDPYINSLVEDAKIALGLTS